MEIKFSLKCNKLLILKKLANVDSEAIWHFRNTKGIAVIFSRVALYANGFKTYFYSTARAGTYLVQILYNIKLSLDPLQLFCAELTETIEHCQHFFCLISG